MRGSVVALSGFLGVPEDWTDVIPESLVLEPPVQPFLQTAEWINTWALQNTSSPRLLAGYSLGGRLAMHALIQNPSVWQQAVILSSHTGLEDSETMACRRSEDAAWAGRFLADPWELLMADWDQRGALKTSKGVHRQSDRYSRKSLAESLVAWSLGQQESLKSALEALDIPILWMAGEQDFPFCEIAKSLQLKHSKSCVRIVPGTGHRILHDKPQAIQKEWPWQR